MNTLLRRRSAATAVCINPYSPLEFRRGLALFAATKARSPSQRPPVVGRRLALALALGLAAAPSLARGEGPAPSDDRRDQQSAGWHRVKARNGIVVYHRDLAKRPFPELRAVGTVAAPMDAVHGALTDPAAICEWVPRCDAVKLLYQDDHRRYITYNRFNFPWPFADRDVVVDTQGHLGRRAAYYRFASLARPPEGLQTALSIPAKPKGVVRMPFMRGHYRLFRLTPGTTRVDYTVVLDFGGSFPPWFVRLATRNSPLTTIERLREWLGDED